MVVSLAHFLGIFSFSWVDVALVGCFKARLEGGVEFTIFGGWVCSQSVVFRDSVT